MSSSSVEVGSGVFEELIVSLLFFFRRYRCVLVNRRFNRTLKYFYYLMKFAISSSFLKSFSPLSMATRFLLIFNSLDKQPDPPI